MTSGTTGYRLSPLQMLEAESIQILREEAAELEKSVVRKRPIAPLWLEADLYLE